jgi:hypothetical protein
MPTRNEILAASFLALGAGGVVVAEVVAGETQPDTLLSGGPHGGEAVVWATSQVLPDGRESMVIDGDIYVKSTEDIAVFGGE